MKYSPRDTIIGVDDPENFPGLGGGGGGGTTTVNIYDISTEGMRARLDPRRFGG